MPATPIPIVVESTLRLGSTFSFTLPLAATPE